VYENREWVWGYRETDHLGGHDPYSAGKAMAELAIAAYRRSYFEATHGGHPSRWHLRARVTSLAAAILPPTACCPTACAR
jgi:hypothetical protein